VQEGEACNGKIKQAIYEKKKKYERKKRVRRIK